MSKQIFHPANARGKANHGWLNSFHSFSFGHFYDPQKVHFGALRVLNDDTVAAGRGFGGHPHDNMEIISIPLEGDLEHKDSMGNVTVIKNGDIQVMSAGTGITHSEYNKNQDKLVKFLQIWVIPNKRNVAPRYGQISLNPDDRKNKLQQILSPNEGDEGVWIHQDAYFHLGTFDENVETVYELKNKSNGVYAFIIYGSFQVDGKELSERDALGIVDAENFEIKALSPKAEILLMEVPMNF